MRLDLAKPIVSFCESGIKSGRVMGLKCVFILVFHPTLPRNTSRRIKFRQVLMLIFVTVTLIYFG